MVRSCPRPTIAAAWIWYWYGEDRSNGYFDSPGVHVYSSYDLYNWKDDGLALRAMSSPDQFENDTYFNKLYKNYTAEQKEIVWRDLSTNSVRTDGWARPSILERPKVVYNKATGKWIMWVHSDGPSSPDSTSTYARAEAGVAIANSPKGPFRWIDSYRLNRVPSDSVPWCGTSSAFDPVSGMARDMNLFVDDDGTAYIIYSSEENRTMYVSKLNRDYTYLSARPENAVQGKDFVRTLPCSQREAPHDVQVRGPVLPRHLRRDRLGREPGAVRDLGEHPRSVHRSRKPDQRTRCGQHLQLPEHQRDPVRPEAEQVRLHG